MFRKVQFQFPLSGKYLCDQGYREEVARLKQSFNSL